MFLFIILHFFNYQYNVNKRYIMWPSMEIRNNNPSIILVRVPIVSIPNTLVIERSARTKRIKCKIRLRNKLSRLCFHLRFSFSMTQRVPSIFANKYKCIVTAISNCYMNSFCNYLVFLNTSSNYWLKWQKFSCKKIILN